MSENSKTQLIAEPGKQEVILIRTFDAPREKVFAAHTDPKLLAQWWGPGFLTNTMEKFEAKPGGQWRVIQKDPQGNEFAFHGVYHEVISPELIVRTFEYEGVPHHVMLETVTFEEVNGKTKLTTQSVFQSVADRDGMVNAGMRSSADEVMDRLAAVLAKI